jgi:hypothetical protein
VTLVLLILAVIWAAVLIPPALRRRAEGRPADTITAFHHQLAVLRRAGPHMSRAGHWMQREGGTAQARSMQRHVALVAPAAPPRAVALTAWSAPRRPSARSQARRRRRDILFSLLVAAGTTLVLGAVPSLRVLWLAHVAVDLLLMGYVSLLVRQRNLATERQLKVRLLPTSRRHEARLEVEGRWLDTDAGWLGPEPALLRRSAN